MDEVVGLLTDILDELREINGKLDDIRGSTICDGSLEDIYDKLDEIIYVFLTIFLYLLKCP